MSEDLHNIIEPVISANEGWQQMQTLLNEHLPVRGRLVKRARSFHYAYMALLLTILLFPALQLNNNFSPARADKKISHSIAGSRTVNSLLTLNKSNTLVTINKLPRNIILLKKTSVHFSFNDDPLLIAGPGNSTAKIAANKSGNNKEKTINGVIEKQPANRFLSSVEIMPTDPFVTYPKGRNKGIAKATWSFFGGVAINTSINNSQYLQPYPVAEARYNITPGFYLAAGLTAWSPVSTTTGGLSKTIYLNDTINNISLYNENTTYSHLRYADIPITMGLNITKNISVQAGMQVSVLLNKKTKKVLSPYDFQMNSITPPVSDPFATLAANMQKDYEVQVHNIDYRFVAGLRYSQKKTTVGLMYQHGLRYVGRGINANKNTNNLLSLNVLFQIK